MVREYLASGTLLQAIISMPAYVRYVDKTDTADTHGRATLQGLC